MAEIDNTIYEKLGERWYEAWDDPVALLRAENHVKTPWILERIRQNFGETKATILDVGCGAGFLSNALAKEGYPVSGVDLSSDSIRVAKLYDKTNSVAYETADALHLPYADQSFDVVTCMDFLEHVEHPEMFIKEFSRVLKPGGLFFFHTFNRSPLSWLMVIKMVEWLVKNTPKHMHVLHLFIKPSELKDFCRKAGLTVRDMTGIRPVFSSIPLRNYFSGVVPQTLKFKLTGPCLLSYLGYARKETL